MEPGTIKWVRQRGGKTQRARACEVAKAITAALEEDGEYAVVNLTAGEYEHEVYRQLLEIDCGGYYVVSHHYKNGPVAEVEYIPTPEEREAWRLPVMTVEPDTDDAVQPALLA